MNPEAMKILVVEDDPQDVELILHALREATPGNSVQVVRDGEEALEFLFCRGEFASRSFDQPPQLVLLDLRLPKLDGLEVLAALKGDPRTRAIPVVALTSSLEEHDLVESYKLGANSYIQKPVQFDSFCQAVKQLGSFWLAVNLPPPSKAFRS